MSIKKRWLFYDYDSGRCTVCKPSTWDPQLLEYVLSTSSHFVFKFKLILENFDPQNWYFLKLGCLDQCISFNSITVHQLNFPGNFANALAVNIHWLILGCDKGAACRDTQVNEVLVMRKMVESYFAIVRRNMTDLVPKIITRFMVVQAESHLQPHLIQHLYRCEFCSSATVLHR